MLAVEVSLAGTSPVPTFVFDEVDSGVGGAAAVEIGRRLAALARSAQVLVVTHLPQVAAYADRHVVVEKSSDGSVTSSGLTTLDDEGRERELSRMLAGLAGSDTAIAHARELLDVARESARQRAGKRS
jgi:DNA repair protein RecN (Recombination protein N)